MNKKYKISSSVMVVIVIAVVIAFNAFITVLTGKFPIKLDMTPNQIYSVSDSTKDYLKNYNTPTEIFILASEAEEDPTVKSVLTKYAAANSNIKLTNIDTKNNPTFGQKYVSDGETLSGKYVVVDGGERFKVFSQSDFYSLNQRTGSANGINVEGKITSALKYVSSTAALNAYIITGHNEIDASSVKAALEGENYVVNELNLLTEEIPGDTSLLVDMSPAADFVVSETAKLDNYFANGGHAQFYFDVQRSEGLDNLYSYLTKWGIQVNDSVAVEQSSSNALSLGGGMALMLPEIQSDDITDAIIKNNRAIAYFPYSKTLTKLFDNSNYITVKPLLTTSKSTYETSNYEDLSQQGETGEFNIGILASNSENNSSVYVSGTSMLLNYTQEELASSYGFANYDYFFNICSYMQGNTDDYTVSAKSLLVNTISIKPITAYVIGIIFAILIPAAILIAGIVVWFKRRHL